MKVYRELSFSGERDVLEKFFSDVYDVFPEHWIKPNNKEMLKEYILADYIGESVPHAEVSIYYGKYVKNDKQINVGNIVPLEKSQLTVDEYNNILSLFYKEVIVPYCTQNRDLKVIGPTSDKFEPLNCITETALGKLTRFCIEANKSTGSAHPHDEERWFDFVCQTVDDGKVFPYDILYNFLMDKDYWRKNNCIEWSEDKAYELANEYSNYVKLLKYYKERRYY